MMRPLVFVGNLVALAVATGCGGDAGTSPQIGTPAFIQVVAGENQAGIVGQPLPGPLEVKVLDGKSQVISGQAVSFVVVSGGGSVFVPTVLSDPAGIARDQWTMGTVAGADTIEARIIDEATGAPLVVARITATAAPAAPDTLEIYRSYFDVIEGDSLNVAGRFHVADRFGNLITNPDFTLDLPSEWKRSGTYVRAPLVEELSAIFVHVGSLTKPVTFGAVPNLRTLTFRARYTCRYYGEALRDTARVDSIVGDALTDSVRYDGDSGVVRFGTRAGFFGHGIFLWFLRNGSTVTDTTAIDALIQEQYPDSLQMIAVIGGRIENSNSGAPVTAVLTQRTPIHVFVGGHWCSMGRYGDAGPLLLEEQ